VDQTDCKHLIFNKDFRACFLKIERDGILLVEKAPLLPQHDGAAII